MNININISSARIAFLLAAKPLYIYNLIENLIKNSKINSENNLEENLENNLEIYQRFFSENINTNINKNIDKNIKIYAEELENTNIHSRKQLLKHILNVNDDYLITHAQNNLSPENLKAFLDVINLHKQGNGVPLAYLIGKQNFYGLDFLVTPDVLIPRLDTEILLEKSIEIILNKFNINNINKINNTNLKINILELGTGSGAISIALLHALNLKGLKNKIDFEIMAVDICPKALAIAQKNELYYFEQTSKNKTTINSEINYAINWLLSDWFSNININLNLNNKNLNKDFKNFEGFEGFNIIISNPPYIDCLDEHLQGSIRYEPMHALTDQPEFINNNSNNNLENIKSSKGLAHIQTIIEQSKNFTKKNSESFVLLEHGYDQAASVSDLFKINGYTKISSHIDGAGNPRITLAAI